MAELQATRGAGIDPAVAIPLAQLVDYGTGAVVSRTLSKGTAGNLTVFAFAEGQGLSEHSAPFDAWVHVLEGETCLTIGGVEVRAKTGEMVLMPANVPHAVAGPGRFKMLLIMQRHQ